MNLGLSEHMTKFAIEKDREYGFLRAPTASSNAIPRREKAADAALFADGIVDAVAAIAGELEGRRVLDLGCRDGGFLDLCRNRGMDCIGWEEVADWAGQARQRGHEILTEILDDVLGAAPESRFDVVTMFNVLQYVDDPAKVLRAIRDNLLSVQGTLVVAVPNTFSPLQLVAVEELGVEEWWVHPDITLNYFDQRSLADILEGCGYAIVDMFADLPRELFLLADGGSERLSGARERVYRIDEILTGHGMSTLLKGLKTALGRLGLGDNIVTIARPDPYSRPCKATVLKETGK